MAQYISSLCCSCCGTRSSSAPQPLQQITIPESANAAISDFDIFLHKFNDMSQIHGLIQVLEEFLKIATGEESGGGSNSAGASYIEDGQRILEILDNRIGKRFVMENTWDGAIAKIERVFIEAIEGAEKIPSVGIALSMLGYVLGRFSEMSDKRSECLQILRSMLILGKQILPLNEQIPEEKQKVNEGVQCIVAGTTICASQLKRANIFRFLTAKVNADCLKAFQIKIDRLYTDIQLYTGIEIRKRVPKLASELQKIYAYEPAVEIESAKESVIQLLDLYSHDAVPIVVVIYGFGGIGKTTLADTVYANLNLQSYKHCRIHLDEYCTSDDLRSLQEQILNELSGKNIRLRNCHEGQESLWSIFKENLNQPLFLYIDNVSRSTYLEQLLPRQLDSCLPPKSRILVTTRNLQETDILVGRAIQRRQYAMSPLPEAEARKILLNKVSDYNDEINISNLLELCGGVPLLLELAGSQLAITRGKTESLVLEMLKVGDISDRIFGSVYNHFLEPVREAFLDIVTYFNSWRSELVVSIVGDEAIRALEAATFVKTSEYGRLIIHNIIQARGKKLSEIEGNGITNPEGLLECLEDEEKLRKLKDIYFNTSHEQPAIEINRYHLNCLSKSLRVLCYQGPQIAFREKCEEPFEQLRYLEIPSNVRDLPMEFKKLERLVYYNGPFTQSMRLYEFPPSLRYMYIVDSAENKTDYSTIPRRVTPASSLVTLFLYSFKTMQRLPHGIEKLTKLQNLCLINCHQLRELPSKLGELSNLRRLILSGCNYLKELPSEFGQLTNLRWLRLEGCSALTALPSTFGHLISLNYLNLGNCSSLKKLPSNFGLLWRCWI